MKPLDGIDVISAVSAMPLYRKWNENVNAVSVSDRAVWMWPAGQRLVTQAMVTMMEVRDDNVAPR
jgi:hypothetical protein